MLMDTHHHAVWSHIQNDGYTDRKGCWQMTGVIRTQADRFEIWLWFRPAEGFLKSGSTEAGGIAGACCTALHR